MRVYYYTKEEHALENIEYKRIKISLLEELNDPFELLAMNLRDRHLRAQIEIARSVIASKFGVLCFSTNRHEPLLWSHYADKHNGICLGFDIPGEKLASITYIKNRIEEQLILQTNPITLNDEIFEKFLTSKYSGWEYEKEVRAQIELNRPDPRGFYFTEFDTDLILREVLIGVRSKLNATDLASKVAHYNNQIEIKNCRIAFKTFSVVDNRAKPIYVHTPVSNQLK